MQKLNPSTGHVFFCQKSWLKQQWFKRVKKLVVEMKVVADGMVHHVAKTFLYFEVFLAANMAKLTLQRGAAV